jgi:hypothetical protein
MQIVSPSSRPVRGFRARYEKLLRKSPRTLEIFCALILIGLALEFLSEVVFWEWFYFRYHRDYAYTTASRIAEWAYELCVALLALWMIGMAWNLLRGASKRRDRGLFSPRALRIWGLAFALLPVIVLAAAPGAVAHFHLLFWCVIAAGACFALAARRSVAPSADPESSAPIE